MILIGHTQAEKSTVISDYRISHGITKTFVLSPDKFAINVPNAETIEYKMIIEYEYFYRLLQEIDQNTLLVINECLRTQNRYDLTYNCIRNFLLQTKHQLIFQYLPIIDTIDDFMILFDFDTRSRWKRNKFERSLLCESSIACHLDRIRFWEIAVPTDDKTKAIYKEKGQKIIDSIGLKDPHTIPRNLYLLAGPSKVKRMTPNRYYIGRNNRFRFPNMITFSDDIPPDKHWTIFEFPHNFIKLCDFICLTGQHEFDVMVSDLKVCQWYFERYTQWASRVNDACDSIVR